MERSFKKEVQALKLGDGETFHGEGILAVTKALLQSGVSYVGGYQGAPVSHLLDVLVDAEDMLAELGVHLETCTNEASAAAMLGASINYPLRGAVTWKSIVGTNVAADALSNLASPGVHRRRADHPRRGLRRGRQRHPGALLRLCAEVLDVAARSAARPADHRAHGREGLRAVRGEPRAGDAGAAHPRLPRHRRVRRQGQPRAGVFRASTASPARRASTTTGWRIRRSTFAQEKLQDRGAPAGRARLHPRAQAQRVHRRRSRRHRHHRAGRARPTACCARSSASASPTSSARRASRCWCSTSSIRWCRRRSRDFCAGKRAVLIVEEGYPDYIEQAINVELRRADIQTKRATARACCRWPANTPPKCCCEGLAALPRRSAADRHRRRRAIAAKARGLLAHKAQRRRRARRRCRRGRRPSAPAARSGRCSPRIKLMQRELGPTHISADIGCHSFATFAPFSHGQLDPRLRHVARQRRRGRAEPADSAPIAVMGDGGFWHNGLITGVASQPVQQGRRRADRHAERLHLGDRPAVHARRARRAGSGARARHRHRADAARAWA